MTRRPAPVRQEKLHMLELGLTELRTWRDGHDSRCEERAEEFRTEAAGIREEMAGMRRDIGRLVQNALDARPKPYDEAEIRRTIMATIAASLPPPSRDKGFRERLQEWLDIGYKIVFIPGGLAAFFLFVGAVLNALGKASIAAGAHLPGH